MFFVEHEVRRKELIAYVGVTSLFLVHLPIFQDVIRMVSLSERERVYVCMCVCMPTVVDNYWRSVGAVDDCRLQRRWGWQQSVWAVVSGEGSSSGDSGWLS